jgi:hypothetical protein
MTENKSPGARVGTSGASNSDQLGGDQNKNIRPITLQQARGTFVSTRHW